MRGRNLPSAWAFAVAALVGVAAAIVLERASGRRRSGDRRPDRDHDHDHEGGRGPWQCACGQRYEVSGSGRHRVYWLEGASEGDPVLGERCPSCDRLLPAESSAAVLE
jgi:hypothetical protein